MYLGRTLYLESRSPPASRYLHYFRMPFHPTSRALFPPTSPSSSSSSRKTLGVSGVANIFSRIRHTQSQVKDHHIESSSGTSQSHPGVVPEPESSKVGPFENTDTFVCIGGVNVIPLLRATRTVVVEVAQSWGANALVDEQWTCRICCGQSNCGIFRVRICYSASGIRSTRPDPHKPVALDQIKGVPGLMTILRRNDF